MLGLRTRAVSYRHPRVHQHKDGLQRLTVDDDSGGRDVAPTRIAVQVASFPSIRLGIDVPQQRMAFDEVVDRVRLGEELGFDGSWGFDHYVPMYGEGPGKCFEAMTRLAALATATSRIRLGLLVRRRDL